MQIVFEDGVLKLKNAPAKSVCEVRFQNTMNGAVTVSTVSTDWKGNAPISLPQHFGQHFAIKVAVLNGSDPKPISFVVDHLSDLLRYVQAEQGSTQVAQDAPAQEEAESEEK